MPLTRKGGKATNQWVLISKVCLYKASILLCIFLLLSWDHACHQPRWWLLTDVPAVLRLEPVQLFRHNNNCNPILFRVLVRCTQRTSPHVIELRKPGIVDKSLNQVQKDEKCNISTDSSHSEMELVVIHLIVDWDFPPVIRRRRYDLRKQLTDWQLSWPYVFIFSQDKPAQTKIYFWAECRIAIAGCYFRTQQPKICKLFHCSRVISLRVAWFCVAETDERERDAAQSYFRMQITGCSLKLISRHNPLVKPIKSRL